jgi:hypothetical protein
MTLNTGKIMIGLSLVLLSIAMMVSPSGAAGPQDSREVGCGIALPQEETGGPAGMHPGINVPFIANEPRTDATYPYER